MDAHQELVDEITSRVRAFHSGGTPFRIYHGSTNSTRKSNFRRDRVVDTSKLSRVLKVDTASKTALVEPNVPMDALVEATLKHGLLPPVVMEFPGITAGGGFMGTAGESSSFKHGFFNSTANWIEIVLADGNVVKASEKENADLFLGSAGSFGTLGILTLLEIRLVDAKKYVELTYQPVHSISDAIRLTTEATRNEDNDYVDGILFGRTSGAVISGRLTDGLNSDTKVQHFSRAKDPWFYLHVQSLVQRSSHTVTELVPVTDYLFRYDRGAFWVAKYGFQYFMVPFNWFTRWAVDYFTHTRYMYHALHKSGHAERYIIQDLALPLSKAEAFISWVDKTLGFYPLWLCPLRSDGKLSMAPGVALPESRLQDQEEYLLNIGVWGPGPSDRQKFIEVNRQVEEIVQRFNGVKWLYAHAYYTEEEFWKIYDKTAYDSLREKYHATSLPTVYEKVKVDLNASHATPTTVRGWLREYLFRVWPLSGVYGVVCAALGGDYLLQRS